MADIADSTAGVAAIAGVDHSIIGVGDLEAARSAYEALGFTTTPRGRHMGWATANYCIMFERDYIELLGIVEPGSYSAGLDVVLAERGEGILKLALRSSDADRSHAWLEEQGLVAEPVKDLARELEAPEGTLLPAFRLVHPDVAALPGLSGFLCQHLTPEIVWRPEWTKHRNTATGVRSYTILADDPPALAAGWRLLLGPDAIHLDGGVLGVETGSARLNFRRRDSLSAGLADVDFPFAEPGAIVGMTVTVRDLVEAAICMAEAGVACIRTDDGMTVLPESACGAAINFVQEG